MKDFELTRGSRANFGYELVLIIDVGSLDTIYDTTQSYRYDIKTCLSKCSSLNICIGFNGIKLRFTDSLKYVQVDELSSSQGSHIISYIDLIDNSIFGTRRHCLTQAFQDSYSGMS